MEYNFKKKSEKENTIFVFMLMLYRNLPSCFRGNLTWTSRKSFARNLEFEPYPRLKSPSLYKLKAIGCVLSPTIAFSCLFYAAISVVYLSKNFCCGWSLGFLSRVCSGKLLFCPLQFSVFGEVDIFSFCSLRKCLWLILLQGVI